LGNVSFYVYEVSFIIQIASARFENAVYNKKTAKKHYNRNIHISQKGNPVKHWHLQQH